MSIPFESDANREFFFGRAHDIVVEHTGDVVMKTTAQLALVDAIARELCAAWQNGFDANGYTGCDDDDCDGCLSDDAPLFEVVE